MISKIQLSTIAMGVSVFVAVSCGGVPPSSLNDGNGSGANGSSSGPGATGSFGDGGTSTAESCNAANSKRACCVNGTQTCMGGGEILTWGPCLDAMGNVLTCNGTGGSGSEDGGKGDGGGNGTGGGGNEDGGGTGTGGGGNEPPAPACMGSPINTEPNILVGYSPASGQTVSSTGQVKVWVDDENAPIIATGEQIDPNTGAITTPGNRSALAPDGYPWEPTLYINGTAHFPTAIKGWYNSATTTRGPGVQGTATDPLPPNAGMAFFQYLAEDIWDVSSLGLSAGTYTAEFVVHDGDRDRAVGCVTIVVN